MMKKEEKKRGRKNRKNRRRKTEENPFIHEIVRDKMCCPVHLARADPVKRLFFSS